VDTRRLLAIITLASWLVWLVLCGALLGSTPARADGPPAAAEVYRNDLVRSANYAFGLNSPIALLAAQVHQESRWDPRARSAYASGLAQFTPATAQTMARQYPGLLRTANPLDPRWALLALCLYDRQLYGMFSQAASEADRWAFALSGYNGGAGWTIKDRALAKRRGLDPERWWGQVETVNAGRGIAFWRENRGYPEAIMKRHQRLYTGWGPDVNMEGTR
jgi:soluble lytic murein transglycosylase-like protein